MLEADDIGMSNPRKDPQIYRYSEAPFWEWQRNYYEDKGITAWQNDEIPQFITSNPMIAVAYAEMIFGLLQDRARLGHTSEVVTMVELGAGSGRLAFHVLKELSELLVFAGTALPPYRYIMSDLAEDNIAYWQQHSGLTPFVEQGVLDFARFDAVRDTEIKLTVSGQIIRTGDLQQPLIVVANYFFDSIPQELIYVEDGNLFDCLVSLQLPDESDHYSTTEKLDNVELEYHYRRADEQSIGMFNDVIVVYRQKLDDAHILIPAIGIRCLERLSALSQQGFMLLTADKGVHRLEHWEYAEPPKLIVHSSFSITVNYHAMKSFYEQKGAHVYFTAHHHRNLNIGCVLMLPDPNDQVNTRLAYRRFVERFGPDDYFSIKQWLDGQLDQLGVQQILALWRLGGYDAEWLIQSAKRISTVLPDMMEDELEDIRNGIHTMWSKYYAVVSNQRVARNCGMLLFQMEYYEDAIPYLEQALEHNVTDAVTLKETSMEVLYHVAICCYEVGRDGEALVYTARTLVIEPEHEGALALKLLLEGLESN